MRDHTGLGIVVALVALTAVMLSMVIPEAPSQTREPKVLFIGMDGVQLEHYKALGPELNLQRLLYHTAYGGGITDRASEQATNSGPGWTTLLTGVWANKHEVTSNDLKLRLNPEFPSLFRRLRLAMPHAYLTSIVNWGPINEAFLVEDVKSNDVARTLATDQLVTLEALQVLDRSAADFTFIQLDEPDQVGHDAGFGSAYDDALRAVDARLGQLLDAVESRTRQYPHEDWLVLLSTDHGRSATGESHGQQSEQEKTIFIASNKPLNDEFSKPSVPHDNPGPNGLYGQAAQTAIAPTVLRHMGVRIQPAWHLDGTPLLGETGVRKARADEPNALLLWNSQATETVIIEKNGERVAEVLASLERWYDPQGMAGVNDYTLTLNGTPVAVRTGVPAYQRGR